MCIFTWKNVKKKSSFFLADPRSKQCPQVSRRVQTRRIRKKSSGRSSGWILPGIGVPPSTMSVNKQDQQRSDIDQLTIAKRDNPIQRVEDDRRVDHLVIVQLSKVLDFSDALLVELELILLESKGDSLEDVVHDPNHEILVVPVESADKNCEEVDIAVFDLDRLRKHTLQDINHLWQQVSIETWNLH